jgi:general secretion pathway protein C
MAARWTAFVLWALAAATAVGWALSVAATPRVVPIHAVTVSTAAAARGDVARILGTEAAPAAAVTSAAPAPGKRLQLVGVIAARTPQGGQGLALISIDGKPARAYAVGAAIDGRQVLQSVSARAAAIGPAGAAPTISLDLPALAAPATGVPGQPAAAPGGTPRAVVLPAVPPPRATLMPAPPPPSPPVGADGQPAPEAVPERAQPPAAATR